MEFITTSIWDEEIWKKASPVYEEAFGRHGAKSKAVIRNMFAKQMCSLHVVIDHSANNSDVIGMALTAKLTAINAMLIDYLAIKKNCRHKGIGELFVNYLKEWSIADMDCDSMILEIEATENPIHQQRIKFWEKCGFHLTDYVHDYKVVPEPYQAMYKKLTPHAKISTEGKELFKHLANFHQKCFRGV